MITEVFLSFIAIALAELGDKTQLAILLISSKTKKHLQLLLGIIIAYVIVDGIAILAGSWFAEIMPMQIIRTVSGALFIAFGLMILLDKREKDEGKLYSKNSFLSGFMLIFIAEMGDKTQIASGLLATQYDALSVLIGAIVALAILSALAIYLGKIISERIDKKLISKVAGIIFILIGLSFFLL
ncbi:MAG: TMEM165/GDT1 family protein [Candidatus Aenigmatarchaeota archaeon]